MRFIRCLDVKNMREAERISTEDYAIPSILLMENAAEGFISALTNEVGSISCKKIRVFCGSGNNGGDGFAIARLCTLHGADVSITILCDMEKISGDAKTNLDIVRKMGIPFVSIESSLDCDIIVDAIFGTGFHGEMTGDARSASLLINKSQAYVASVDIPSGVNADTGEASVSSVFADLCVTFGAIKVGQLFFPAREHFKKLIKTDISIPANVINDLCKIYNIIDNHILNNLPERKENSHKGSFGKLLAFVGSKGMSGAAVLSVSSALKSGVGVTVAAIPECIYDATASSIISSLTMPLPCKNDVLSNSSVDLVIEESIKYDAVLAGCGIGNSENAKKIVYRLITEVNKPIVIDADGLNAISKSPDILYKKKGEIILTPHVMEFSRLSGLLVSEIKENPIKCATDFAVKYDITVVLKDSVTVVATKTGDCYILSSANSGLAKAGSGDILAGLIAGLLSQGLDAASASACGVYIHAASGIVCRDRLGSFGMTSEDILSSIPLVFKENIDILPDIKEL